MPDPVSVTIPFQSMHSPLRAVANERQLRACGENEHRWLQPSDGLVAHSTFTVGGGREALRELLSQPPGERPTAVMCSSDLMAIGALQEASALGLSVPRNLSIVGFDGIDAATWTNPPLTTVEQPIDEIARSAVEALRGQVERPFERHPSYVFRPRLRAGGTTAPPSSAAETS